MPRSARTKSQAPSEAHNLAYTPAPPPSLADPLPVTLGELHDLIDHFGMLLTYTVTDDGGLNISWTAGMLRTPTGAVVLTIAGSDTCTDDAINHLKWVSGNTLTLSTVEGVHGVEICIGHIGCQDGDIWEVHTEPIIAVLLPDIQNGLEAIFPLAVASGCLVSEDTDATDPLDVTVSAGVYYHDLHDAHVIAAFDTRTANTLIRCFIDGSGPETWDFTADGAQSEIDVANWNSGTSLIGTSVGKFYKGLFLISEDNVFWIYAQAEHNTIAQAIDASLPTIPAGLTLFPRSVSYVYKHGDTAFEAATSDRWEDVRPVIAASIAAGPITAHANLIGNPAPADDHTQYLHIDGRRALSAPWAANNDITGLTKLEVDNIRLDGNTIIAISGALFVTSATGNVLIGSSSNDVLISATFSKIQLTSPNIELQNLTGDVLVSFNTVDQDSSLTYMETEDEFRFGSPVLAAIVAGGAASAGNLTLTSTTHGTKGKLLLGAAGTSAYDEVTDRLGLGTASPQQHLHISRAVPIIRLSDSNAATDQAVATLIEFYRGDNTSRVGYWGMESWSNDVMVLATDYAAGAIRLSTGSAVTALIIDSSQNFDFQDGNLTTTGTAAFAVTTLQETGTVKANLDIMQLVNPVNAADMDGTRTSILWRLARVTDTLLDAGRIGFEAADDWTATGSTQDADFVIECLEQGVMTEKLRITPSSSGGLFDTIGRMSNRRGDGFSNPFIIFSHADSAVLAPAFSMRRARGTFATPTAVVSGTRIGQLVWRGMDSTSGTFQGRASVTCECDGAVSAGTVPMNVLFATGTSSRIDRLTIDSSGDVTLNTSGVRLNFGGTTEYIEDGGSSLDFFTNNTKRLEILVGALLLVSGGTALGKLGWDANYVKLFHVSTEKQRIAVSSVQFADPMLIGSVSTVPASSAILELLSTTGALLLPRMTTTQRNALTAVDGMILYNSTTGQFNFREGGAWVTGSGLA